jgi:hypothetical protein
MGSFSGVWGNSAHTGNTENSSPSPVTFLLSQRFVRGLHLQEPRGGQGGRLGCLGDVEMAKLLYSENPDSTVGSQRISNGSLERQEGCLQEVPLSSSTLPGWSRGDGGMGRKALQGEGLLWTKARRWEKAGFSGLVGRKCGRMRKETQAGCDSRVTGPRH